MPKSLKQWLDWQESLHPSEIDLGLDRVEQVLHRLLPACFDLKAKDNYPFTVITIAGTNGKGSTVAMLESILTEAGYRVGSYTSPHLLHYNERVKINQIPVKDELLCHSFERINEARSELTLTYFEFATLAAVDIFYQQSCEIVILEVGLGGRLDAVNIIEPDVALVTTIGIDHQDWLGSDRESIGIEKAGIYRKNKPAIFGDEDLPESIKRITEHQSLSFFQYSVNYHYKLRTQLSQQPQQSQQSQQWDWLFLDKNLDAQSDNVCRYNLPLPNLHGSAQLKNASNALMVLELLKQSCPVTQAEIKRGLQNVQLPGRFQIVSTEPLIILDVAHNVQATEVLRDSLRQLSKKAAKLHVIVGMLKDKEVLKVLSVLAPMVDSWRVIDLNTSRAMPAEEIAMLLKNNDELAQSVKTKVNCFHTFEQAYHDYNLNQRMFNSMDTLLVFGSFYTVTDAMNILTPLHQ